MEFKWAFEFNCWTELDSTAIQLHD